VPRKDRGQGRLYDRRPDWSGESEKYWNRRNKREGRTPRGPDGSPSGGGSKLPPGTPLPPPDSSTFHRPEDLAAAIERHIAGVVSSIGRAVTGRVVDATPIDTTHARSNWIPSIGTPHEGEAGSKESPSSVEQSVGLAQLQSYRLEQGDIFVTNNVPYMGALDSGSSPQAEAGFIDDAIVEALDNLFT